MRSPTRIAQLTISGFRGIKDGKVTFPPHSVLLGANNVGKSTVAEGLALLCGREGLTKPVGDWDFNEGSPKADSRFEMVATITDFGDPAKDDPTNYPDWFVGEAAATPVWWNEDKDQLINQVDSPGNARLAAQIAVAGRYDDENCEFEIVRFFYDGKCDPFVDAVRRVPRAVLRDLGVFFLPGDRQWDRLLAFASSSFLKVLREYDAVPGAGIEKLKAELRSEITRLEEESPLKDVIAAAERELRAFLMLADAGKLVYRPTALDTLSVLRCLVPHMAHTAELLIPVERSGSGLISLQSFVLLLAFSQRRLKENRNFILVADEPELHLHPSLHRRLVNRIRASSTQSIAMTQSPGIAAGYQPSEALFLRKKDGVLSSLRLRKEPISAINRNSVEKLYLDYREELYDALMGSVLVVPEGKWDWRWLMLWQRIAETSDLAIGFCPVSLVPTSDAAVVESFKELHRLREDAIPLVDGDAPGDGYLNQLVRLAKAPKNVVQFGKDAGIECLSAWELEPALKKPPPTLKGLLPNTSARSLKALQDALIAKKKEGELHENLAWEASEVAECVGRACEFFSDLTRISGGTPLINAGWQKSAPAANLSLFRATHISRG